MKFDTTIIVQGQSKECQDRAAIIEREDGLVLVVADGVGGRSGGAEAAEYVANAVSVRAGGFERESIKSGKFWASLLGDLDQELTFDEDAGETTAIVAGVSASGIAGASVGDSEAWLITASDWRVLTEGQKRKPYLGYGESTPAQFRAALAGATLLIATDGLFKYAAAEKICGIARQADLQLAATALVDLARLPTGGLWDDIAIILCRIKDDNA